MNEQQTSTRIAPESLRDPGLMGPTRYERRSGSLPHLEDQTGAGVSGDDLPSPITAHLRPFARLRNLIGS